MSSLYIRSLSLSKTALVLILLQFCLRKVFTTAADYESARPRKHVAQDSTTRAIKSILDEILLWQKEQRSSSDRPFVTLTFAQSLDGKIALKGASNDDSASATSSNLPLSGEESLLLTHGLRSIHDAILVGGKTLCTDNPRLSNRLWGDAQPRPVVLDTHLEHVRKLGSARKARNIIICCSYKAAESFQIHNEVSLELLSCKCDANGRLILADVLQRLQDTYGIRSVMVEGGASVHSAFLSERLVDCLCVTIAPKILGNERGLACFSSINTWTANAPQQYIDLACGSGISRFVPLGNDCIYLCQWSHKYKD